MKSGSVFPKIGDKLLRAKIWSNLMRIQCPIPSLYTFQEDIRYLQPLVGIMKRISGFPTRKGSKTTLRVVLEQSFTGANQHEDHVQVQEAKFAVKTYRGNLEDRLDLGIWQAWLYLMREFTNMVPECPKKEKGKPTPTPKRPNPAAWYHFAMYMYRLGFESDEIHRQMRRDTDREIAHNSLLDARSPEDYVYNELDLKSHEDGMVKMYNTARRKTPSAGNPVLFVDGLGEDLERRCGRTFENAYEYDRKHLFLNVLGGSNWAGGRGITSLFVRISVCFAFFGKPSFSTGTLQSVKLAADEQPTNILQVPQQPQHPTTLAEASLNSKPTATQQHNDDMSGTTRTNEPIEAVDGELTALRQQMDEIQIQNEKLVDSLTRKGEDLNAVRESLQQELNDCHAKSQIQFNMHAKLSEENEEFKTKIGKAESEIDTLRKERDQLNRKLL